jgi:hypothetical protein
MSSSKSSKGLVQFSRAAEDSQTELYNKRKALEHLKYGLPKSQLSHQDSKEHGHALLEISADFPQKKQKIVPQQFQCDIDGVYRDEYDP